MHRVHRLVFAISWTLLAPRLFAQCIDYSQAPRVATYLNESFVGCEVVGHLAYAATNDSLFCIVDVSNPSAPLTLGQLVVPFAPGQLAVSGTLAYVLTLEPGVAVIDVSDSTRPTLVDQVALPAYGQSIAIDGPRACVTANAQGFWILDLSNPLAPVVGGSLDTPGFAYGVAVRGSLAYVTDATSYPSSTVAALHIVDITDATAPRLLSTYTDYMDSAFDVDLRGPFAYISDRVDLHIVNVANPAAPFRAGGHPIAACDLALDGPHAFVAWGCYPSATSGFAVLDVSQPVEPIRLSSISDVWTGRLTGANGVVVGYPGYPGAAVIDVRHPRAPEALEAIPTRAAGASLVIAASHAYVCEWDTGFEIFELTNPTSWTSVGFIDTPALAGDVKIVGSLAYVADTYSGEPSALLVIDVSTPSAPILAHRTDTAGEARAVEVEGSFAYIADGGNGLVVADLSAPRTPVLRGSVRMGTQQVFDVAVQGPYAYLAAGSLGLVVVDVTNPDQPAIVTIQPAAVGLYHERLAIQGGFAYLVGNGLEIMDISDPNHPVSLASFQLPAARAIALDGTLAYLASYSTLYAVDVTDPGAPLWIGSVPLAGFSGGVTFASNHVYVLAGGSVLVFPPHCELPASAPDRMSMVSAGLVLENPAHGSMAVDFAVARAGDAQLRIYDVRGRLVRRLFDQPVASGRQRVVWDGRDQHGLWVSSGTYFVQLRHARTNRVQRGVLIR